MVARKRRTLSCNGAFGLEPLEGRLLMAFSANVNFQAGNTPIPGGYVPDYGNAFAARGGGLTFGWNVNNYNGVDRNNPASPDQRHDTFNFLQPASGPKIWEIVVPNGSYSVKVVAGDPAFFGHTHNINAEGQLAVRGTTTSATRWLTGTITVAVTDGRLTLAAAAGASGARLNFVEVRELTVSPPPPPVAQVGVTGLTLVDAATDQDLGPVTNGMTIDVSGGRQYSVRAAATAATQSAVFRLDGAAIRTESSLPFSVAGDDPKPDGGVDYNPWAVGTGQHTLSAQGYGATAGEGMAGAAVTVDLTVVDGPVQPPPVPPPPPISGTLSLRAAADAYALNGATANANYGTSGELQVRLSSYAGHWRESFLRFDLSQVASADQVTSAVLRLTGRLSGAGSVTLGLFPVTAGAGWSEGGLTWDNKPVSGNAAIGPLKTLTNTGDGTFDFDVAGDLKQQKAAGAADVTFVLKATNYSSPHVIFASDEAAAGRPELSVTQGGPVSPPPPPAPSIVLSQSAATVAEGQSTSSPTVRLSAQPAGDGDVIVTVTRQSGDADLSFAPGAFVFGAATWSTPQPLTLSAAHDADATNGSAVFALSAPDMAAVTLSATEQDDDVVSPPPPPPTTTPAKVSGAAIGTAGSYNNAGNTIAKALDGNLSTYFDAPATSASGAWVGLDLGSARRVTQVKFAPRGGWANRMVGGRFQASHTANFTSGVVDLHTVTAAPAVGVLTAADVNPAAAAYRYVRYLSPAYSYGNVAEVQFFGHGSGPVSPPPAAAPAVGRLALVNTDTGQDVGTLTDGGTVDVGQLGTALSIRADLAPGSPAAGSVTFLLDGQRYHLENFVPYHIAGADGAAARPLPLAPGFHTLVVLPYAAADAGGTVGQGLSVAFTVTPLAPSAAPAAGLDAARVRQLFDFAARQLDLTAAAFAGTGKYPRVTQPDGKWTQTGTPEWSSGFFPGSLWQMYKRTGDARWKDLATPLANGLRVNASGTEDTAFKLFLPLLQVYATTGDPAVRSLLLQAAAAKSTQYDPDVKAFHTTWRQSSSGNPRANFGVLMDQMMDTELMFWAARQTGNQTYYNQAVDNARTVATHLIRPDGGSFHWGYFDRDTGDFVSGETAQGYSNGSTWARGQAWGIYAFAMAYRETGLPEFLTAAKRMSDYFMANLPADKVPFWDFDDPKIPSTFKDTSAGSIAAAGVLLLADVAPAAADQTAYAAHGGQLLAALAGPEYLAEGTSSRSILNRGAWYVPFPVLSGESGTVWGDNYFLEALNRYSGRI